MKIKRLITRLREDELRERIATAVYSTMLTSQIAKAARIAGVDTSEVERAFDEWRGMTVCEQCGVLHKRAEIAHGHGRCLTCTARDDR